MVEYNNIRALVLWGFLKTESCSVVGISAGAGTDTFLSFSGEALPALSSQQLLERQEREGERAELSVCVAVHTPHHQYPDKNPS